MASPEGQKQGGGSFFWLNRTKSDSQLQTREKEAPIEQPKIILPGTPPRPSPLSNGYNNTAATDRPSSPDHRVQVMKSNSGPNPPSKLQPAPVPVKAIVDRKQALNKHLSAKKVDLKIDALVGNDRANISKSAELGLIVQELIKLIIRSQSIDSSTEKQPYQLWIPPCPQYKHGIQMDPRKKLGDYDEEALVSNVLELKPKATTLRAPKVPSLRGKDVIKPGALPTNTPASESIAPTPLKFLADPNARITVKETSQGSLAIAFEYTETEEVWTKPDLEGEIMKQGSKIKRNWKVRHCKLVGNKIFFFKTKDADPASSLDLKGGMVSKSSNPKQFAMDVTAVDPLTNKFITITLAATSAEDYCAWMDAFEKAIYNTEKTNVVSQNVNISFSPQEGYVGLPEEWKQMLSQCGVTERYFYENPEAVLQMLRYYRNTMPEAVTSHAAPRMIVNSIDDVINKEAQPETLYEDFVLIGSGTFGEVYKAVNKRSQQKVAIKKMLLTPKREPLFISEISVQKNTEHPNVVKLFDAYRVDDHIWVALEFMEGGNLYQILSALEEAHLLLTEPQIAYIITETLKALSYIHGMHRIHRDIKSDNILVGKNAEIKLADFGYAVQLTDEDEKRTTMAGSPYWMAPEIIEGEEYGKEVDIWSLGIMLMECCDLQPPYINEPPSKALMLITTQPPPPLAKPQQWTRELKHLVSILLQRDSAKRPMSIELLQHPFLRCTCSPKEFRDSVLSSNKKPAKPCLIQ